jgi:hypothetical protein
LGLRALVVTAAVTVLTAFVVKSITNPRVPLPKKKPENNFNLLVFRKYPPLYLRRGYFVFCGVWGFFPHGLPAVDPIF